MLKFEMEMSNYGMEVLTKANNMDRVMDFVELCIKDVGNPRDTKQLTLVGEELAFNIFQYAYDDAPGTFLLKIFLCPEQNKVTMEFRDAGKPYNPLEHKISDLDAHISDREIGGLGIMLSKKFTDTQIYKYENGHNILLVEKYLKSS
ncbi:MAG: ATP-binding protein [Defluviitaleaceae bacterium]|nr:ATP-binding protein [Defluviitaleaceae bacterium]